MFEESDNEIDYTSRFRIESSQDSEKFRARRSKVTRTNRSRKMASTPGSTRLRRNKHWSW